MGRTEKAMLMNMPDNFVIARCKLYGNNFGGTFEPGEANIFHPRTLASSLKSKKRSGIAFQGYFGGVFDSRICIFHYPVLMEKVIRAAAVMGVGIWGVPKSSGHPNQKPSAPFSSRNVVHRSVRRKLKNLETFSSRRFRPLTRKRERRCTV